MAMKARNKRAKRGRPRNADAIRTPEGRISRSMEARVSEERLALEAATWKRRQVNPALTVEEARQPQHGSVIALWLDNHQRFVKRYPGKPHEHEFSQIHYDTAMRYHELHHAYLGAIAAARPRSSSDFSGASGYDGRDPFSKDHERRMKRVEEDYKAARSAVLTSGSLGMVAVEGIVLENRPLESLRPDLRCALNRLATLWKMAAAA